MEHRPGGKSDVVLSVAEEAVIEEITLHPPAQRPKQFVIHSSSQGVSEIGLRDRRGREAGAFAHMASPKQGMRERPHSAYRKGELRPNQEMVHGVIHLCLRWYATGHIAAHCGRSLRTIMAAEIGHQADQGQELHFR